MTITMLLKNTLQSAKLSQAAKQITQEKPS